MNWIKDKICRNCGKKFFKTSKISYTQWKSRNYCSKKCGAMGKTNMLGKKHSLESKLKMSKLAMGKLKSEEAKKNMSLVKKGKPSAVLGMHWKLSEETKKKMSIAKKGTICSLESRKKLSESHKGEKSHFWRGGITEQNNNFRRIIMNSYLYRIWRSSIFKRDNFICQSCGKQGGKLNADHVKPFIEIIRSGQIDTVEKALACTELWNIENGQTLCESCHINTPTYGGRMNFRNVQINI